MQPSSPSARAFGTLITVVLTVLRGSGLAGSMGGMTRWEPLSVTASQLQSKLRHNKGLSIRFEGAELPSTAAAIARHSTANSNTTLLNPKSRHNTEQPKCALTGEALGFWQVDVGVADQPHANRGVLDDAVVHAAQGLGNEHLAGGPAGWHGRLGPWVTHSQKASKGRWIRGEGGEGKGSVVQARCLQTDCSPVSTSVVPMLPRG